MVYRFTKLSLLALVTLTLASGCRGPSIGKLFDEDLPPEVVSKYGPTAISKIEQIEQLARAAERSTPSEQHRIAQLLAQQIGAERDTIIRAKIIAAITSTRTPLASEVLRAGLNDEDIDVQIAACDALGIWGGGDAVSALAKVLEDKEANLDVRLAATKALAGVQDASAARALGLALEDRQDPALQYRAAQSLRSVTGLDYGNNLVAWRDYVASLGSPLPGPSGVYIANPNATPTPSGERQFYR
jgi:hypothetical protein